MSDKKGLDQWRDRIGHDKAEEITRLASERGNALDQFCKDYLMNRPIAFDGYDMFDKNIEIFKRLKRKLDEEVDDILGVDIPLLSHKYKIAGTADVLAGYKQRPAVIDIKSVKNTKKIIEPKLKKYTHQVTGYKLMVKEMYDLDLRWAVLMFGTEYNEPVPVFPIDITDTEVQQLENLIEQFNSKLGLRV